MFRLPSLKALTQGLQQVIRRFPLVVVAAAFKTGALFLLIEFSESRPDYFPAIRLIMTSFLTLPLVLSLHLVAERRRWSPLRLGAGLLVVLALVTLYYFSLESEPIQRDYYRFGMFLVCAHLLVSFAPFVGYDEPNGFWQFNKIMLLQLITATLYAGTLYLGLLVAIETARFLFDLSFSFKIEIDLLVFSFGFLHTLFFLHGFPSHLDILEEQTSYSQGVKVFTQYVLLPLVVVYLVILYVYSGKILIQWQLPEGGVAYLVMAFSVAGILALLLVYPLRDRAGERWIRLFTRRFHLALFPLIVLLFAGIYRRIHDYGITENRYLVAALAIWLAGLSFYFLLSKKDDIRWIPLSLCVFSFLLAVGPWSIFSVARHNQAQRFEALLEQHHLLSPNRTLTGHATLPKSTYDQLISSIRFFRNRRESARLRPYFTSLPPAANQDALASAMEKQINEAVSSEEPTLASADNLYYALEAGSRGMEVRIQGFDFLWTVQFSATQQQERGNWKVESADGGARLIVFRNDQQLVTWDIASRLAELNTSHGASAYDLAPASLTFDHDQVRLILTSASKNGANYTYQGFLIGKE